MSHTSDLRTAEPATPATRRSRTRIALDAFFALGTLAIVVFAFWVRFSSAGITWFYSFLLLHGAGPNQIESDDRFFYAIAGVFAGAVGLELTLMMAQLIGRHTWRASCLSIWVLSAIMALTVVYGHTYG
jgi:hypothetical protein